MIESENSHLPSRSGLLTSSRFNLLRRLSITSLVAMLVTVSVLILLYWQDQISEHKIIATEENERTAIFLMQLLGDRINTLILKSNVPHPRILRMQPNLDKSIASALKTIREYDIIKLKIYNLSGVTIYSSIRSEIGGSSQHPDLLSKALHGDTVHRVVYRDSMSGISGTKHGVDVSSMYMPVTLAGKLIGAIEIHDDATHVFEHLQTKIIQITLILVTSFALLYASLFYIVFRADRAVREWEKLIAESEESLRESQIIARLGSYILDIRTGLWKSSEMLDQLFGIDDSYDHSLKGWEALLHPEDREEIVDYLRNEVIAKRKAFDKEFRIIRRNDQAERWVHALGNLLLDRHGLPLKLQGTLQDITERKAIADEINNLAFYDTLTRLPNRRLLDDRMGKAIAASKRSGRFGAVMFLDLDNFKQLNDKHGHGVGDLLLVEVAHRLIRCVREVDTVARFGGDEFVVVLGELEEHETECATLANIVAEKIRSALSEPFVLTFKHKGESELTVMHHCETSIGVVIFNSEVSAENALKWADIAMYQAKGAGRNLIRFFDSNG